METTAIRMKKKDENNFWKIDVGKLNRKMMYANRIKNQGMKARISKELIPIIGFFSMRGDSGPISHTIHQKLQLQTN